MTSDRDERLQRIRDYVAQFDDDDLNSTHYGLVVGSLILEADDARWLLAEIERLERIVNAWRANYHDDLKSEGYNADFLLDARDKEIARQIDGES